MDHEPLKKAKAWVNNDYYSEESRQEIQKLIDNDDMKEIVDRFYKDLEFGTGGIRGIIGAGINRMNEYNVRKATQALANVIKEIGTNDPKVAISYDSRRFSLEFAKITASVLAGNNIKALIYKRLNPVCLLSFSVRHHKAVAGVMITASHNPPEYNGYKVYWSDGAQVTPPYDKNIIKKYGELTDHSEIQFINFDEGVKRELIHWVGEDVERTYLDKIKTKAINPKLCKERGRELSFVYTPIHGTGLVPCTEALKDLGLTNYHIVEAQRDPDGDFPTVESPNPENPKALKMAVDLMKEKNADIAIGSDPDADRLGIAIPHQGEIHYLNGNQIGTLMFYYMLTNLEEQKRLPQDPYFIKTIVTTPLQEKIAKQFGVEVFNTLTGFKWMCGKMRELEKSDPNKNFLFATEESFGYLNHDFVRDKDGVSPIVLLAEMSLYYKLQGKTFIDVLDEIYQKFGFHQESLTNINYYGKEGADKIVRIMDNFRKDVTSSFADNEVTEIYDYEKSEKKILTNGKSEGLDLPKSNVLGYFFKNGSRVFLRPSGTEPKIKFYIMIQEGEGGLEVCKKKALEQITTIENFIKTECEKA